MVAALALSLVCAPAAAQVSVSDSARAAIQQRMMRWVLPGAEHRQLQSLEGEWDVTVVFPGVPGRPPTLLDGKASARPEIGGRFLMIKTSAATGGSVFEGLAILGFDGRSEEYTYVGFDSFGTYYVSARGRGDLETGSLELEGEDRESAERTKHFAVRLVRSGADSFALSIDFQNPTGGSFTVMESRFRRRAGAQGSELTRELGDDRQEARRRGAAELREIANEVRLVGVPAADRHRRP